MIRRIIQFIFILVLPFKLFAQSEDSSINDWVSHPVTKVSSSDRTNLVSNRYYVYLKDNQVRSSRTLQDSTRQKSPFNFSPSGFNQNMTMSGKKSVIKVSNGYLIGFDNGEFGGSLYWFSEDGKQSRLVSNHSVKSFLKVDNKIFALEGLDHMGVDRGSILSISLSAGNWVADNYVKFPNDPKAIGNDSKGNLIVVSGSSILSISNATTITVLNSFEEWKPSIWQTDLIIKDDIAYIGMNDGVYKLNLKSGIATWLLPR